MYLVTGESKKLEYSYKSINGNLGEFYTDDNIVNINGDVITAKEVGTTTIYKEKLQLKVITTDLINLPTLDKNNTL